MLKKSGLVISVDCSTTACKCMAWDRHGISVAEGRSPLTLFTSRPAWHEQSAESWWNGTVEAIQTTVRQIDPRQIEALCITHQRETFVPVDRQGVPLRNAILWMDERAASLLPKLEKRLASKAFQSLSGKHLSGNLSLGKIAWLQEHEPETCENAFKYLDVQAYLILQLTGLYRTSWGSADPMGLFDMHQNRWSPDILNVIDLREDQLPEAFPPGAWVGNVTKHAANACGLPEGIPVVAGLGDGQAAGLGAHVTGEGRSTLSLGTSVVSGTFSRKFIISENFRTMYGGIPNTYLLETVILGGAYTIHWFIHRLAGFGSAGPETMTYPEKELEREAESIPAGAEGLMLVPYWNSAMNPFWDAKASGIAVGWRGVHQRGHVYRAILEGIAFEQRLHTSGVEQALGKPVNQYIASGGGATSDLWCQIIADVTGKEVLRTKTTETALLGAAILAAAAMGWYPDVKQAAGAMVHLEQAPIKPDSSRHAFYSRLYEQVYRHLYPALRPSLDRLAELTEGDSPLAASGQVRDQDAQANADEDKPA